jgi:hypothetical protein
MGIEYPLPAPPPAPGMGRGTRVLLWGLGTCSVVAILLIVGSLVFGGIAFSRMFNLQLGGTTAPRDFPVYPAARLSTGIKMGAKNGGAGQSITLVQWQVRADASTVRAWYAERLNQGDWEVVDDTGRAINFRRRSTGAVAILQVTGQLGTSIIQLEMTGDQPLEPGAAPATTT